SSISRSCHNAGLPARSSRAIRSITTYRPENGVVMPDPNRRLLAGTLILAPLGALLRSTPSVAQSPIVQPTEKTKAGFLEHARGLRDQAVRDACRRRKMRDLSDCEVYSPPRPASCVRRPSI